MCDPSSMPEVLDKPHVAESTPPPSFPCVGAPALISEDTALGTEKWIVMRDDFGNYLRLRVASRQTTESGRSAPSLSSRCGAPNLETT